MLHEGMMIYVRRMLHERMILHQEDNAAQGDDTVWGDDLRVLIFYSILMSMLMNCHCVPEHLIIALVSWSWRPTFVQLAHGSSRSNSACLARLVIFARHEQLVTSRVPSLVHELGWAQKPCLFASTESMPCQIIWTMGRDMAGLPTWSLGLRTRYLPHIGIRVDVLSEIPGLRLIGKTPEKCPYISATTIFMCDDEWIRI